MEGLPKFSAGDNAEEWCVKLSNWLENQPYLSRLLAGESVSSRNLDLTGTLDVTGATVLDSTLNVAGETTVSTLHATGAATLDSTLSVTGTASLLGAFKTGYSNVTASATSVQGGSPLTETMNLIGVCATTGDSVTLPAAQAGLFVVITNRGANSADVFPASGGFIDALTQNSAKALAQNATMLCIGLGSSTWECPVLSR